jgi:PAS domain S-box-containing protein
MRIISISAFVETEARAGVRLKHILIVEDEVIIGLHLKLMLEGIGYTAAGPEDTLAGALEQARRLRPDIALVDIGLHGSDAGIEIAARLRSEMDIPVIFVTAYTDELVAQKARLTEPFGYLSKPFDARSLKATLEMALMRYQMERQLKASEERYRYLYEHMAQGIVYQDADGQVISANPAALRILGLTLDQLLGRTSQDPRWRAIHADGSPLPGEEHPAMIALRTGRAVSGLVMGIQQGDSGNTRWILVNATPQFLPGAEKPFQVFASFEDITAQKEAERALRQSEATFHSLLEHLPVIVSRFDRQHRHLYINSAVEKDVPFSPDYFLGKTNSELSMPVERARLWDSAIEDAFVRGEKQTIRFSVADFGPERTFETIFVPERDENGRIETVLSVNIDISAQTRP